MYSEYFVSPIEIPRDAIINTAIPKLIAKIRLAEKSNIDLRIHYFFEHASIVVWSYGEDFMDVFQAMMKTLEKENLLSVLLHLPLHNPYTKVIVSEIEEQLQFFFSGLFKVMVNI